MTYNKFKLLSAQQQYEYVFTADKLMYLKRAIQEIDSKRDKMSFIAVDSENNIRITGKASTIDEAKSIAFEVYGEKINSFTFVIK